MTGQIRAAAGAHRAWCTSFRQRRGPSSLHSGSRCRARHGVTSSRTVGSQRWAGPRGWVVGSPSTRRPSRNAGRVTVQWGVAVMDRVTGRRAEDGSSSAVSCSGWWSWIPRCLMWWLLPAGRAQVLARPGRPGLSGPPRRRSGQGTAAGPSEHSGARSALDAGRRPGGSPSSRQPAGPRAGAGFPRAAPAGEAGPRRSASLAAPDPAGAARQPRPAGRRGQPPERARAAGGPAGRHGDASGDEGHGGGDPDRGRLVDRERQGVGRSAARWRPARPAQGPPWAVAGPAGGWTGRPG
jgi:hypothetical protein